MAEQEQQTTNADDDENEELSLNDIDSKYRWGFVASLVLFFALGYYVSWLLSLFVFTTAFGAIAFYWFQSTDLSVEITVFLAKFFPPSKYAVWDCVKTPECAWSKAFRDNYKVIYQEYLEFEKKYNYCPQMDDVYPNGSITNWDRKWPTVNLRVYGLDTKISQYFPKTMKLVNASDTWLSHVMFSILKPNKFIPRHRGPYRGVLRYHLHLEIPEHSDYEKQLYLAVWPKTSSHEFWNPENVPSNKPILVGWKDGNDFLFDDTCVHEVINFTGKRRIILFMDVARHDIPYLSKLVHMFFMSIAKFMPAIQKCKSVQDDYLKKCVDKATNQQCRFTANDQKDLDEDWYEIYESNDWMKYNTAPEILPFKQARMVIAKKRKEQRLLEQQTQKRKTQNK